MIEIYNRGFSKPKPIPQSSITFAIAFVIIGTASKMPHLLIDERPGAW